MKAKANKTFIPIRVTWAQCASVQQIKIANKRAINLAMNFITFILK